MSVKFGLPREETMVKMLLQWFPSKVEEYASEECIPVWQAAEEMIEGYVVSGTVMEFLEACERIELEDDMAKALDCTTKLETAE